METSLLLDNKTKQLNLFFKKRFEHQNDVCLKLHGLVNTVTTKAQIEGSLLKVNILPTMQQTQLWHYSLLSQNNKNLFPRPDPAPL